MMGGNEDGDKDGGGGGVEKEGAAGVWAGRRRGRREQIRAAVQ